jgi:tetratricopeptide (TPR) repeat protein
MGTRSTLKAWIALLPLTAVLFCGLSISATADEAQCVISKAKDDPSWDPDCAKAIFAEHDALKKAELLFRHAYVLNERELYERAIKELNAAITFVPHSPEYLRERAYTLNSLARYGEALVDLDELISLNPKLQAAYPERAMSRTYVGDWQGALADREVAVQLKPDSMSALVARAQANLWLGNFEQAQQDLNAAKELAPDPSNGSGDETYLERVNGQLQAWTKHSEGRNPGQNCSRAKNNEDLSKETLIGDCTIAFFSAKTPQDKADALVQRAIAWISARQSQRDATADHEASVALDPENPDRHTNLGFAYLEGRHSWAARQEFDRSIKIRKTYPALAGRASAHYNLNEINLSFKDAKESFEMQPNELALWVLGDLAKDKNDDKSAKLYWMGAYHLGSRDDRLMERLRSVGVTDPAAESKKPSLP